jgi:hypothetical protein
MKDLQDATENICDLKGSLVALDVLVTALLQEVQPELRDRVARSFAGHAEVARTVLLHTPISESTVHAFERDVARMAAFIESAPRAAGVEPLR